MEYIFLSKCYIAIGSMLPCVSIIKHITLTGWRRRSMIYVHITVYLIRIMCEFWHDIARCRRSVILCVLFVTYLVIPQIIPECMRYLELIINVFLYLTLHFTIECLSLTIFCQPQWYFVLAVNRDVISPESLDE